MRSVGLSVLLAPRLLPTKTDVKALNTQHSHACVGTTLHTVPIKATE